MSQFLQKNGLGIYVHENASVPVLSSCFLRGIVFICLPSVCPPSVWLLRGRQLVCLCPALSPGPWPMPGAQEILVLTNERMRKTARMEILLEPR